MTDFVWVGSRGGFYQPYLTNTNNLDQPAPHLQNLYGFGVGAGFTNHI